MYKIFAGKKCIIIQNSQVKVEGEKVKVIEFRSSEELHSEYKAFARASKLQKLIVVGEEEKIWRVFRSLFFLIEAAGGLVKNEKGELLMIHRLGHWDLPKGKTEKGETPDETALREVEEECGVRKLKIVKPLVSTYHIFSKKDKECIKRTYWFEMTCKDSRKPVPQAEEGITEVKWMNKAEVKKVMDTIYPSLLEVLTFG